MPDIVWNMFRPVSHQLVAAVHFPMMAKFCVSCCSFKLLCTTCKTALRNQMVSRLPHPKKLFEKKILHNHFLCDFCAIFMRIQGCCMARIVLVQLT